MASGGQDRRVAREREPLRRLDRADQERLRFEQLRVEILALARDFAQRPEQVGYYLADLERAGGLVPEHREAVLGELARARGADFALRVLGSTRGREPSPRLPPGLQAALERYFGSDVARTPIAIEEDASSSGARAFTDGDQIVFAPGMFDVGAREGVTRIAHEMAHVAQILGATTGIASTVGAVENEAARAATGFLAGAAHFAPQERPAAGRRWHDGPTAAECEAAQKLLRSIKPGQYLWGQVPEQRVSFFFNAEDYLAGLPGSACGDRPSTISSTSGPR